MSWYNWADSSAMASTWVFSGQARESEEYFDEELGTHRLGLLYTTWLHRSELGTRLLAQRDYETRNHSGSGVRSSNAAGFNSLVLRTTDNNAPIEQCGQRQRRSEETTTRGCICVK